MSENQLYNEKELLLKVAEGNEIAFRQLFQQWHQLLAGYILRITESRETTEEIVQDVFLKIWMTREVLGEIQDFKHYLLVVSRNQSFDVLKRQLKETKKKRDWERENQQLVPTDNAPDDYSSLIDEAIDNLPTRRKEVYLLSRHERLSYQEIADKLSISRESVKTHLKLASSSISTYIRSRMLILAMCAISQFRIF